MIPQVYLGTADLHPFSTTLKDEIMQELRTQLHSDGQQQQDLLDQQHEFIQELEVKQQQLQVRFSFMS